MPEKSSTPITENITVANLATILFFLAVIWVAYDLLICRSQRRHIGADTHPLEQTYTHEGFADSGTQNQSGISNELFAKQASPEIINEMAQQLNSIDAADRHLARDQLSHYIIHPDVITQYRETTETMLENLKKQVDAHSQEKRKQLERLNTYLLNLQEYVEADFLDRQRRQKIAAIKSHNNGQELALIPVSSRLNQGQVVNNRFRVRVNGGCMRVPENNNYEVVPLSMEDPDQLFKLEMIYNETGYRNALDKAFPQISDLGQVRYPFAILRATSNGNCLRNNHGRLSVEPCREHEGQRWAILEESQLPKCI